jgi:hypothetical protein
VVVTEEGVTGEEARESVAVEEEPNQGDDFRIRWAVEMRHDGLTWTQIEDATGFSAKKIRRGARRLGLELPVDPRSTVSSTQTKYDDRSRLPLKESTHEGNLIPALYKSATEHCDFLRERIAWQDRVIEQAEREKAEWQKELAKVSAVLGIIG